MTTSLFTIAADICGQTETSILPVSRHNMYEADHARKDDGAHRAFGTTERALSVAYTPTHCAGVTV